MKIESVATARLVLQPLTAEVAGAVVAGEPGPGCSWAEGYPGVADVAVAGRAVRRWAEDGDPGVFGAYEIRLLGSDLAIGGIGFHGPPDEIGVVTVGYGLVPSHRGRGYASEALRALVEAARRAGASGVKGDADLDNPSSHRVMEAAGMRRVAEDEKLRHFYLGF
ncbi:GNAT family N-acetyltransferase [Streptomyces sp. NPDC014891]|uniref:GNAT family N-acetyltransferase n=1 Tax=Streptomyces sp. NPDC014891 TaxID=3364929 RepID=UPI0036F7F7BA